MKLERVTHYSKELQCTYGYIESNKKVAARLEKKANQHCDPETAKLTPTYTERDIDLFLAYVEVAKHEPDDYTRYLNEHADWLDEQNTRESVRPI